MNYDEIERHNSANDCWIVIRGRVCNITEYLEQHPGGSDILLDLAGKNATKEFIDVGHSSQAEKTMMELSIGEINDYDACEPAATSAISLWAMVAVVVVLAIKPIYFYLLSTKA